MLKKEHFFNLFGHDAFLAKDAAVIGSILDDLPEAIHSINARGELVYVNQYWLDLLGYQDPSEVLGRPSTHFLTISSREFAEQIVLPNFFAKGTCKDVPYQFVTRDGSIKNVLLTATRQISDNGQTIRSIAILKEANAKHFVGRHLDLLHKKNPGELDSISSETPYEKLRVLRKQQELNQSEMAEMLNLGVRTYQRIEYGESPITTDLIIKASQHFRVEPSWFFFS